MTNKRYWLDRARLPVAGIILVTFLLSLAVIQGCGGSDETDAEPTATPAKEEVGYAGTVRAQKERLYPDRPDFQDPDTELPDGGSAQQATWVVGATFQETTDSIGGSVTAGAGNRFLIYKVVVENRSQPKSIAAVREFKLIDPQGTVVALREGGLEVISGGVVDPNAGAGFTKIGSGDSMEGILSFEVPIQSGWHYLAFKSRIPGPGRLVWGIQIP